MLIFLKYERLVRLIITLGLLHLVINANCQIIYCKIAPMVANKCADFHNNNSQAPFNLSTYLGLKQNATLVKKVINSGYMPPWPADNLYAS